MNEIQYKDIFRDPETIQNLKGKSAQARERMLGNDNLMQIMRRSATLISQLMQDEAPYKEQLEQLAVRMVKKMYPVIDEFGIEIEATLGMAQLPPMEPGEPELQIPQPQVPQVDIMNDEVAKRRLINAITQGASIRGALDKPFIEFLNEVPDNLLDSYSETLAGIDGSVDKYGETLKKVFGIFHDEQAIAMMLAMLAAQAGGGGGGESKGGESEATFDDDGKLKIRATGLIFPFLIHEIIKGLYEIVSLQGFTKDKETNTATVAAADRLEYEPEDFAIGTHIQEALEELYNNARVFNKISFELFLANLYREDDAAAFVEFIENLINNRVTAAQQQWAEDHMEPMAEEDEDDMEGMYESKKPYRDLKVTKDYIIREFNQNIDPIELKWHRDREDRIVEIVGKTDWKIQLEDQLPTSLNESIFIPKGEWHRLVKGNNKLTLKIYK